MKTRKRLLGLAAALAVAGAGIFTFDIIQHARLDLISLQIDDIPLDEALSRIARQTGESIVADRSLQGRVRLHVDRAPLQQVLASVADQVGALARRNLAVAASPGSWSRLERTLQEGRGVEAGGWRIAGANSAGLPSIQATESDRPALRPKPAAGDHESKRVVLRENGTTSTRLDTDGSTVLHAGSGRARTRLMIQRPGGEPQEYDLSPDRLLIDKDLSPGTPPSVPATGDPARTASAVARTLGARWKAIYALEALPSLPGGLPERLNLAAWKSADSASEAIPLDAETQVRRDAFNRFTRLSPDQRAVSRGVSAPGGEVRMEIDVERP